MNYWEGLWMSRFPQPSESTNSWCTVVDVWARTEVLDALPPSKTTAANSETSIIRRPRSTLLQPRQGFVSFRVFPRSLPASCFCHLCLRYGRDLLQEPSAQRFPAFAPDGEGLNDPAS